MPFVNLHLYSESSVSGSTIDVKGLMRRLGVLGQTAVALTNEGGLDGILQFHQASREAGIKPLVGCEFYVAPRTRFDKSEPADRLYHRLVLIASSFEGCVNLRKLSCLAHEAGLRPRPCIDMESLSTYGKGLFALSAGVGGAVPRALLDSGVDAAVSVALAHREIFGDNYYLEVQANSLPEWRVVNLGLVEVSARTGIPLVATGDCRYLAPEDREAHEVLLCIQTNRKIFDSARTVDGVGHVRSGEDVLQELCYVPGIEAAVEAAVRIAEACECFDIPHAQNEDHVWPSLIFPHPDMVMISQGAVISIGTGKLPTRRS